MARTVSKSVINKCRPGDRRLLFLILESEERANNHQKQNTITSSARSGDELKLPAAE